MKNSFFTLFIEINKHSYVFFTCKNDEQNNFKIIYRLETTIKGIENNKISDLETVLDVIKNNIYIAEQRLGHTFNEVVLILENFNPSFISLSGYKKLNGSRILRENITYILNTLKFYVDEIESKKTILHIFNSKFSLDYKKIENPPIGLFGDFYSHELSFSLIDKNDYKNLQNLFEKCNLRIKKILLKSFIKGVFLSEKYLDLDTFYFIEVDTNSSRVFYFENNCLKFEQSFKFGYDIILKDISKITLLKKETIVEILNKIEFSHSIPSEELIEKEFFEDGNYKKIKKKLIFEIIQARINEILEIIIFKNVNFQYYNKSPKPLFLRFSNELNSQSIKRIYKTTLSHKGLTDIRNSNEISHESLLNAANKLVHFGWKKEAIPFIKTKKSLIARFFSSIFE